MLRQAFLTAVLLIGGLFVTPADAQFRRGILSENTPIVLYPIDVPALLLPAGDVQIEVRNASGASARIVERLQESLDKQLTDNDSRLAVVPKGAEVVLAVTLIEWTESRRDSTMSVSEQRQVGERQVKDKNGKIKTEPIYEYRRERPSVVIDGTATLRLEVRRGRGPAIAEETVTHRLYDEYLAESGPPTRDAVEGMLIDQLAQKGAGRVSPGRVPTRVMLARSDEVDRLNSLALNRRWPEWLAAMSALEPHRDVKRDAYRLHNLAVAHEALAYEATAPEDWSTHLTRANALVKQALTQNPNEKYIAESAERIGGRATRYQQLAEMYREIGTARASMPRQADGSSPGGQPSPDTANRPPAPTASENASLKSSVMTNQDVIDLRAAALDDDNLIAAIGDAKSVRFDLSAAGLKALLAAKVSNRVIAAMQARAK